MNTAGRNTLVDDASNRIRQMIFEGQIKPGEMLPPRKELAARFDVGISTIQEAIKSLNAVGLVESRPGKGTWVRANALDSVINPSLITNRFGQIEVETIYEARSMLEIAIAELAAKKATKKDIKAIWAALNLSREVIEDDAAFVKADWDFHMAVANACHNVLIETFYHLSRELLLDFVRDVIQLPKVKEEASQLHIKQTQAIENHDAEQARRYALEHMLYLKDRMGI